MKITNKDLIQSYILTAASYDFNVYEKRVLYRLVEICQSQLNGQKLNSDFHIDKTLFGDYVLTLPIKAFLKNNEDFNYERVKDALRRLRDKTVDIYSFNEHDEYEWKYVGIIEKPKFDKKGFAIFEVQPEIYDAILNFSKGFRKYELKTAMEFDTIYAMRFYELLSGKNEPITYTIEHLKIMFQLEGKYKLNADFCRYVIDVAQKELSKKAPYSFEYELNKIKNKAVSITFYPCKIEQNRDVNLEKNELQKQISLSWDLDKIIIDYLKQNYLFDDVEIKRNIDIFKKADSKIDLLLFLSKKRVLAETKKNPKGWIINAIKKETENQNSIKT